MREVWIRAIVGGVDVWTGWLLVVYPGILVGIGCGLGSGGSGGIEIEKQIRIFPLISTLPYQALSMGKSKVHKKACSSSSTTL